MSSPQSYGGWVVRLARTVLRLFFRRIEVVGLDRIDLERPRLLVANHNNGLVDPALLVGFLPGRPRFLGKATLWRMPWIRPFLALAKVIPISRRQDPGFDPSVNEDSFAACRDALTAGGSIALFPEGRSHSEPTLAPLKTGAARIALGAIGAGLPSLDIVPIGLVFEEGARFRSSVLIKVGRPLTVDGGSDEDFEAVEELTARLARALASVTLNYPSWPEARAIERSVEVFRRGEAALPGQGRAEARVQITQAFVEGYHALVARDPQRLVELRRLVDDYDRLLDAWKLRDDQVLADYPLPGVTQYFLRTLATLFLLLPAAVVGGAAHLVPYRLCGLIGSAVARHPDQPATYKLFGGMFLFPLTWGVLAVAVGRLAGFGAGALAAVALPVTGWAAMEFRDHGGGLLREARAFFLLRARKGLRRELRDRRDRLRREVLSAVESVSSPASTAP